MAKPLNIMIICQNAGSPLHGMVYRPYFLAKNLNKLGHKTKVVASAVSHLHTRSPELNALCKHEMVEGVQYLWVRGRKYTSSRSLGRIYSLVQFALALIPVFFKIRHERPDAIIFSSPPPFAFPVVWVYAKLKRAKLIFEVRDIWPRTLIDLGSYSKKNPLIMALQSIETFAYRRSDLIVSVLKHLEKHVAEVCPELGGHKIRYLPNGIECQEDPIAAGQRPIEIPSGAFVIGYAGTIGIANENILLLQAALTLKNHPDIWFVFIGEGGEKDRLQEFARRNQLTQVLFLAPVAKREILKHISYFDAGFLGAKNVPLYQFGISANKIFDYMLARLPILMAIHSGHDIVKEADCGEMISSGNSDDLAQAILRLKDLTPEQRQAKGNSGHLFLKKNHDYAILANKYADEIFRLLKLH